MCSKSTNTLAYYTKTVTKRFIELNDVKNSWKSAFISINKNRHLAFLYYLVFHECMYLVNLEELKGVADLVTGL
jgi:hypothetical protein